MDQSYKQQNGELLFGGKGKIFETMLLVFLEGGRQSTFHSISYVANRCCIKIVGTKHPDC